MEVAVCVITYRRPEGLKRLLESLNALTFQAQALDLRVVVVENDETGLAQRVCNDVRSTLRWPLEYHVEPRRGIPFARNKAVAVSKHTANFIAFIDDDEVPEPNWLDELIRVQREHNADVVTGPVLPHFMEKPPSWIVSGKFFERQRYPTGCQRDRAYTSNVLFRTEIFDKLDPIFDERLAMTGSSDAHFSRRVHQAGYTILWANEAIVHDWLPASRVNGRWILQRAFRVGTTTAFILLDLYPMAKALVLGLASGCFHLFFGTVLLVVGWVRGRVGLVKSLRELCYGAGMLLGLFGTRYQEYRRTHGE